MRVRLALESDARTIVDMARTNMEQTRSTLTFDEDRCLATIASYLHTASPTIWVAETKDGEVVGFLVADFYEYRAASGIFTTQEVLFVRPDKRGTRAAAILMKELVAWSQMLGAKEIVGGNDNEFNSERTARFLEHFGFERVGFSMRRAL
jgi:L-amino acid N-acyltransferase YncA